MLHCSWNAGMHAVGAAAHWLSVHRMVIHVTLSAMRVGAAARGWFAVVPACAFVMPWRCMATQSPGTLAATQAAVTRPEPAAPAAPREPDPPAPQAMAKAEEPTDRIALVPAGSPRAQSPTLALADEVVVKAVASWHQAFLSCWTHARRSAEPPLEAKVRLHLEVDPEGQVTTATSDSDSPVLERCLAVVARGLRFPAPGQTATVDVPLLFQ
jgi:hypothetical protein